VVQAVPAWAPGWCIETIRVTVPIASIFLRLGTLLHLEAYMVALIPGVSVMRPEKTKQRER
jgi:hypothetical protein